MVKNIASIASTTTFTKLPEEVVDGIALGFGVMSGPEIIIKIDSSCMVAKAN